MSSGGEVVQIFSQAASICLSELCILLTLVDSPLSTETRVVDGTLLKIVIVLTELFVLALDLTGMFVN